MTTVISRPKSAIVESFRKARKRYRPGKVRLLWIAESPPTSGSYFYFPQTTGKDHLFRETMRALGMWPEREAMRKGVEKRPFLERFRSEGFFLIDACSYPVDKLSDKERQRAILKGTTSVTQQVSELNPDGIIIVKSNVYDPVRRVLGSTAFAGRILNRSPLPFPSHGRQKSFRKEIRGLLEKFGA